MFILVLFRESSWQQCLIPSSFCENRRCRSPKLFCKSAVGLMCQHARARSKARFQARLRHTFQDLSLETVPKSRERYLSSVQQSKLLEPYAMAPRHRTQTWTLCRRRPWRLSSSGAFPKKQLLLYLHTPYLYGVYTYIYT